MKSAGTYLRVKDGMPARCGIDPVHEKSDPVNAGRELMVSLANTAITQHDAYLELKTN
jgi:hypothetical protein